ncbi:MAG: hypothetical protein GXO68_02580 [Crenarchaeota archaeon]|nr:hypothetical protein [Thermoproteota archaeon]
MVSSDKECVEQDTIVKEVTQATSINEDKVKETLARLHREGYVYKPKRDCFQVVE